MQMTRGELYISIYKLGELTLRRASRVVHAAFRVYNSKARGRCTYGPSSAQLCKVAAPRSSLCDEQLSYACVFTRPLTG